MYKSPVFISACEPLQIALVGGGASGSTNGNSGGAGGYATMQLAANVPYQVTTFIDVSQGTRRVLTDMALNQPILSVGGGGIGKRNGTSPFTGATGGYTYTCVSGSSVNSLISAIGGGGGGYYYMNNYRGNSAGVTGGVGTISETNNSARTSIRPAGFGSGGGALNGSLKSSGGTGIRANTLFSDWPDTNTPGATSINYQLPNNGLIIIRGGDPLYNPSYMSAFNSPPLPDVYLGNNFLTPIGSDTLGRYYYLISANNSLTVNTNVGTLPSLTQLYANVWLFNTINGSKNIMNGSFKIVDTVNTSPSYNIVVSSSSCSITDPDTNTTITSTSGNPTNLTIYSFIQSMYPSRYITWTSTPTVSEGIIYVVDNASTATIAPTNPNYIQFVASLTTHAPTTAAATTVAATTVAATTVAATTVAATTVAATTVAATTPAPTTIAPTNTLIIFDGTQSSLIPDYTDSSGNIYYLLV